MTTENTVSIATVSNTALTLEESRAKWQARQTSIAFDGSLMTVTEQIDYMLRTSKHWSTDVVLTPKELETLQVGSVKNLVARQAAELKVSTAYDLADVAATKEVNSLARKFQATKDTQDLKKSSKVVEPTASTTTSTASSVDATKAALEAYPDVAATLRNSPDKAIREKAQLNQAEIEEMRKTFIAAFGKAAAR